MEKYIIDTPCGQIEGTKGRQDGVVAYKGIRYATAGRWEYPTVVTKWDGIYDATEYGNCSYQPRAFYDEEKVPEKAFYYNEFRKGEVYTYDEDCLFLNIWKPEDATADSKLPVLFYIHGGGFTGGCGHEKHFDGPVWPTKGVIGITINYRLGPLGFICMKELEDEAGHTGNYALFDQRAALQWVKANIAAFGGDPDNVTIMGQSAGGMSVQQLCISPLTDGLFAKAVMCSGGGVHKVLSAGDPANMYEFWDKVMHECGANNLEEFRAVSPEKLFEVWQTLKKTEKKGAMATAPVLDNVFITFTGINALNAKAQKNIPYMVGSTSEDIMPPIIFKMARDWCIAQAEQDMQKSYTWFFDRRLPGDDNGAWHSSDLWYWFGTLGNCWRPMTDKDYDISNQMVDYLMNFVKNGDPNGDGLVKWEPMSKRQKNVLRIGEEATHMGGVSMLKLAKTMVTNKAVGE